MYKIILLKEFEKHFTFCRSLVPLVNIPAYEAWRGSQKLKIGLQSLKPCLIWDEQSRWHTN